MAVRLPKVNAALAQKMMKRDGAVLRDSDSEEDLGDAKKSSSKGSAGGSNGGIIDPRFAKLFEKEEFQQDEDAEDFRLRNPTRAAVDKNGKRRRDAEDSEDDMGDLYSGANTAMVKSAPSSGRWRR